MSEKTKDIKVEVIDKKIYALNLDPEDSRVLSATEDQYGAKGQPRVDHLPDDDISDYKYIDGEFVYDPLPKPPEPVPVEYVTYDELAKAIQEGVNSYGI
jgi:hypothetical protein|uniref:Uncharacterized protein n=1 Tax=virus sp. ctyMK1 TaxID=2828002 RepID=A0A8S5RF81_9VIRU|nr:MAG TPA: hypothetical protein [virus sp. ctyMK1]